MRCIAGAHVWMDNKSKVTGSVSAINQDYLGKLLVTIIYEGKENNNLKNVNSFSKVQWNLYYLYTCIVPQDPLFKFLYYTKDINKGFH